MGEIKEAYSTVRKVAHWTPFIHSRTISRFVGGEVYLKLECLQRTGSFKIRGAYYAISKLGREVKSRGCVAASAGNHAQGVALAASSLGVKATVVMPRFSPTAKVNATQGYGAEVILHGDNYDEAVTEAYRICKQRNAIFIHSFDDPRVIAGQGTIGLEMMEDIPDLDVIVVPIGGGGLISGTSVAVKNLNPNIDIYGVQASGAPSMVCSLNEGCPVELQKIDTIADGIAIKKPSKLTLGITKRLVDETVIVTDGEIADATFLLLERTKQVVEPAGAVGLAALLTRKIRVTGKKVGVIISGGNIDMSLLVRIVERSLYKESRFIKISGLLPDRPGALKKVLTIIANFKVNVVTITHDREDPQISLGKARITLTLELPKKQYLHDLTKKLKEAGYSFSTIQCR
ncbi:MAG: threonine ammonia-lyase [Thermoproteota archaeon]